jgi:hypothetical protein
VPLGHQPDAGTVLLKRPEQLGGGIPQGGNHTDAGDDGSAISHIFDSRISFRATTLSLKLGNILLKERKIKRCCISLRAFFDAAVKKPSGDIKIAPAA